MQTELCLVCQHAIKNQLAGLHTSGELFGQGKELFVDSALKLPFNFQTEVEFFQEEQKHHPVRNDRQTHLSLSAPSAASHLDPSD